MAEMIRSGDLFYNLVKPRIIRDNKARSKIKKITNDENYFGSFLEATDFAATCMSKQLNGSNFLNTNSRKHGKR